MIIAHILKPGTNKRGSIIDYKNPILHAIYENITKEQGVGKGILSFLSRYNSDMIEKADIKTTNELVEAVKKIDVNYETTDEGSIDRFVMKTACQKDAKRKMDMLKTSINHVLDQYDTGLSFGYKIIEKK